MPGIQGCFIIIDLRAGLEIHCGSDWQVTLQHHIQYVDLETQSHMNLTVILKTISENTYVRNLSFLNI